MRWTETPIGCQPTRDECLDQTPCDTCPSRRQPAFCWLCFTTGLWVATAVVITTYLLQVLR